MHEYEPITVGTGVACPKCGEGEIVERKSSGVVSSMVVIAIHNVILRYGISQLMSSVIHVVVSSLKKRIKMVRQRNSALMKHVQLDRQRKRERKSLMSQ